MNVNFLERGGLWVLWQSALLCVVIAGGVLCRNQWESLVVTLGGALLLLVMSNGSDGSYLGSTEKYSLPNRGQRKLAGMLNDCHREAG